MTMTITVNAPAVRLIAAELLVNVALPRLKVKGGAFNVDGLKLYLTRRTQKAQSYYLTVDAGAGGVAVARDGGRRDDERKTENGER
jgi:hypothetical protein